MIQLFRRKTNSFWVGLSQITNYVGGMWRPLNIYLVRAFCFVLWFQNFMNHFGGWISFALLSWGKKKCVVVFPWDAFSRRICRFPRSFGVNGKITSRCVGSSRCYLVFLIIPKVCRLFWEKKLMRCHMNFNF